MKVGKHPVVSALMKGISNERPPQPRYRYIWDVEMVLQKIRSMPDNSNLSRQQLTLKTVTLLGLCAINSGNELSTFNTKCMSKANGKLMDVIHACLV